MIDGMGYRWIDKVRVGFVGMPNFEGNATMTGNVGNGYAKITPIAIGDYNLVKFNYYDMNYSDYAYVLNNSDYSITFDENYADVIVKYKNGSPYDNYSYDSVSKRLDIYDVTDDIEISVIKAFSYENYSYSSDPG